MNTLYRAVYVTRIGEKRRMTFAHSGGIKAALEFAKLWSLADDRLVRVETVRPLARPQFSLQSDLLNQGV